MSKYIDADEVEKWLSCGCAYAVRELQTIDIVRCGECIHNPWNEDYDYTCIWDDDFADRPQTPNDFCSYGERMEP